MQKCMIFIDGIHDLLEDIEKYKMQFPETHLPYEKVKQALEKRENDPVGSVFGINVATDWEDKCYGFEVDRVRPDATIFLYCGTWKT